MNPLYIPNYEINALIYSCLTTSELFERIINFNKKAVRCINPKNKDFSPNDLLFYLDQISIIRDVLILNKPILELKAVKEGLEKDLGEYLYNAQTVSKRDQRRVEIVVEQVKGEIEEASKYLAEAISLRRQKR